MRALLHHRDGRVYLVGQCLSVAGTSALWLATAIWTKMLTGSDSAAGLIFLAYVCGAMLAPVCGVLADRTRRRPLLIAANLGVAAWVCLLLLVDGEGQLWLIYLVMFGYGAAGGLINAAQTALLAVILPDELLGEANALLQMAEVGLRVVTPLAGAGLLVWIGPEPVILLDAATFVVAGLTVIAIRPDEPRPSPRTEGRLDEFTAGIRHIGRTPALRRLAGAAVTVLLAFGFFQSVLFAVVGEGLHRTPSFMGVLEAVMGVGALTGGLLAAPAMRRTSERALVMISLAIGAAACALLTSGVLPLVLAAMALSGLCIVWVNVGVYTLIQRRTPKDLLGRVDAALGMAILIPQALSIAVGAALVAVIDYRVLLLAMSATFLLAAAQLRTPDPSPVPVDTPLTPEDAR
ncbi:MFS transporter [Spirillospora sp. CA-294931]|uniref:MFS transporter n=1 Tax=Spirillospora sp. CA-294931 TaxID=3240042 RepID=UPI003D90B5FF